MRGKRAPAVACSALLPSAVRRALRAGVLHLRGVGVMFHLVAAQPVNPLMSACVEVVDTAAADLGAVVAHGDVAHAGLRLRVFHASAVVAASAAGDDRCQLCAAGDDRCKL